MRLACHCGAVAVRIAQSPEYVHECNCSLCRKSGALWGYFNPSDVHVDGPTRGYTRPDKASAGASVRFCERCGCTTHFTLTEAAIAAFGNTMAGVNMRLAEEADLAGVERRSPDGRAWAGDGAFSYVRGPHRMGARQA